MILTTDETAWVNNRLAGYGIKYVEIYDEIKDHLLSAIETARTEGDTRDIETIFEEIVRRHFPGYWPFEDVVNQYRKAYGRKISQTMWINFKHYLNWQTLPLILLLVTSGFYLPETKPVTLVLIMALLITSIIPAVYMYVKTINIKIEKGKQSLIKSYVMARCYFLIWGFNLVFDVIAPLSREWRPIGFLNPAHYPAVILMLMFSIIVIYGLSCIRLVKQEFKIAP